MILFTGFLLLFLSAAPALAAESKSPWQIEWEKTLEAADKEGVVSAYIFDGYWEDIGTIRSFYETNSVAYE